MTEQGTGLAGSAQVGTGAIKTESRHTSMSMRECLLGFLLRCPAGFHSFAHLEDDKEHIALVFKGPGLGSVPLVRIHSECLTGDVFGSARCDCGDQLAEAVKPLGYVIGPPPGAGETANK